MSDKSCENIKIHFIYCVVFLIIIIIAIASDRWTGKSNFTEYLSNAATMTSLVLGLVAIFYSFIANNGLSQSLGNINEVSNDVRESKKVMEDFLKLTNYASEKASVNFTDLTNALSIMETHTKSLNEAVSQIPTRFDRLENQFAATAQALGEKKNSTITTPHDESPPEKFLRTSSVVGNLLVYACVLARKNDKEIALDVLAEEIGATSRDYLFGYFICMKAAGFVEIKKISEKNWAWKIKSINPHIEKHAKDYLVEYIENTYNGKTEEKAKWLNRIVVTESLFS